MIAFNGYFCAALLLALAGMMYWALTAGDPRG